MKACALAVLLALAGLCPAADFGFGPRRHSRRRLRFSGFGPRRHATHVSRRRKFSFGPKTRYESTEQVESDFGQPGRTPSTSSVEWQFGSPGPDGRQDAPTRTFAGSAFAAGNCPRSGGANLYVSNRCEGPVWRVRYFSAPTFGDGFVRLWVTYVRGGGKLTLRVWNLREKQFTLTSEQMAPWMGKRKRYDFPMHFERFYAHGRTRRGRIVGGMSAGNSMELISSGGLQFTLHKVEFAQEGRRLRMPRGWKDHFNPRTTRGADGRSRTVIRVRASRPGWSDTGLKVSPGDVLKFVARGSVTLGGGPRDFGPWFPDGRGHHGRRPPQGNLARLQARIGDTEFYVDRFKTLVAKTGGPLRLRIFDGNHKDNSGWYTVTIQARKGGAPGK